MAIIRHSKGSISAVYACVPAEIIDNRTTATVFSQDELESFIKHVGIDRRRVCREETCASDLCYYAARQLMAEQDVSPDSVDMLLYVTQSPDFLTPATACILQDRLGLPKETAAMDIKMACSGYVYGLSSAMAYCSCEGINRILLLAGDTPSRIVSSRDRATSLLPGDAGTATLIENRECRTGVSLNTDGAGAKTLYVPGGALRMPASDESLKMQSFDDGSLRNAHQLVMDGLNVFNFTVREVSKDVQRILAHEHMTVDDIDSFIFHQANEFIVDFILKKRKIPSEKAPLSLKEYGNTVCASIPLTAVTEYGGSTVRNMRVLLCGYGGGLSWGTAVTLLEQCTFGKLIVRDDL